MRGRRFLIGLVSLHAQLLYSQVPLGDTSSIPEVEIRKQSSGHRWNTQGIRLGEELTQGEFKRAACCTLSESFELNNTVEVSNADGVSGIKQVEMLGLAGKYVNMSRDNIPLIQGMNLLNGLSAIPGPMVSNVHINKGTSSVTLGHDGITGALNYALAADPMGPGLFLNAYQNSQMRQEFNAVAKAQINARTFNHTYANSARQAGITDRNQDGFSDMPLSNRWLLGNHSQFYGEKFESQWGFTLWKESKKAGEIDNVSKAISENPDDFRFEAEEQRFEAYAKLGVFLNEDGSSSWGNILTFSQHENQTLLNSLIGRNYEGKERRFEYQTFYQSPEFGEIFNVKAGIQLSVDQANESLISEAFRTPSSTLVSSDDFTIDRLERNAALFAEWIKEGDLSFVLGLRADRNSLFGTFLSPRFNVKWEPKPNHKLYASGGLGRRSPWAIIEYLPLMTASRQIRWTGTASTPYGLAQEKAVNGGLSYVGSITAFGYPSTWTIDAFMTQFLVQTVLDRDQQAESLVIQSLTGDQAGQTRSLHIEWSGYFHRRLSFKWAYRFVDNQVWLGNETGQFQFQQSPFQSRHRGLMVWGYETRTDWFFDLTAQFNGRKRLPNADYWQEISESPAYALWNAQIRKTWKRLDAYIGMENMGNQMAPTAIRRLANTDFVDPTFAWGPTNGRMVYIGLRYTLP
jgi:outer membrane receptor for ferrienterochelin and colicins